MVKEFECKKLKAAMHGQLLHWGSWIAPNHTYKYNDDIFKKGIILPDGKNHGLLNPDGPSK